MQQCRYSYVRTSRRCSLGPVWGRLRGTPPIHVLHGRANTFLSLTPEYQLVNPHAGVHGTNGSSGGGRTIRASFLPVAASTVGGKTEGTLARVHSPATNIAFTNVSFRVVAFESAPAAVTRVFWAIIRVQRSQDGKHLAAGLFPAFFVTSWLGSESQVHRHTMQRACSIFQQ